MSLTLSARMGSSADQIWLLVGSYYFSAYCPLRSDGQRCCPLWRLCAHSSHVIIASPPARIYFQHVNDTVPFKKLNGFKGPKLKISYFLSGSEADWLEASQQKNVWTKLRNLRKQVNEDHRAKSTKKSKAIWKVVNCERTTRKDVSEMIWKLNTDGVKTEDPNKVAELFNEYFACIVKETLKMNSLHQASS
ncbi:hypothetical protein J6590_025863 [Homalodisca vitripennis]|nr:hypothetical protein J6590_025863 [Homalodisca vitripennis]